MLVKSHVELTTGYIGPSLEISVPLYEYHFFYVGRYKCHVAFPTAEHYRCFIGPHYMEDVVTPGMKGVLSAYKQLTHS